MHQVAETLPKEVLDLMHAPPKPPLPIITPEILATYDAFLMGVPTRFGNYPAQWKAFWDSTTGLWMHGARGKVWGCLREYLELQGRAGNQVLEYDEVSLMPCGASSLTSSPDSTLVHHGVIHVPLGYVHTFKQLEAPHGAPAPTPGRTARASRARGRPYLGEVVLGYFKRAF
ncbi:hypothetical protein B0H17DRAFT_1061546 [Mycena rosella]|uniref:Uncharacterized protein n=1 Tax=Mycena rosella TaxID=1033263 RepID=A0AAD7GIH9_MYCRO|nr:hypothetical protein B0H17DRAFT_1061546 [Mycena rosella]